jgi:hypothetical protein
MYASGEPQLGGNFHFYCKKWAYPQVSLKIISSLNSEMLSTVHHAKFVLVPGVNGGLKPS